MNNAELKLFKIYMDGKDIEDLFFWIVRADFWTTENMERLAIY